CRSLKEKINKIKKENGCNEKNIVVNIHIMEISEISEISNDDIMEIKEALEKEFLNLKVNITNNLVEEKGSVILCNEG
ncbi:MAG: hypothetical protein WCR27_01395, partial [Eubacteriales bacterium]